MTKFILCLTFSIISFPLFSTDTVKYRTRNLRLKTIAEKKILPSDEIKRK